MLGGITSLTQQQNERRIQMLSTILQTLFKLGMIAGLAFMVLCTVFVVVCVVRGDIKINITRNETEKENE